MLKILMGPISIAEQTLYDGAWSVLAIFFYVIFDARIYF